MAAPAYGVALDFTGTVFSGPVFYAPPGPAPSPLELERRHVFDRMVSCQARLELREEQAADAGIAAATLAKNELYERHRLEHEDWERSVVDDDDDDNAADDGKTTTTLTTATKTKTNDHDAESPSWSTDSDGYAETKSGACKKTTKTDNDYKTTTTRTETIR